MQCERFATLVTPHTGVMLRAAAVLVGPWDAEDAVQEALLHAWRGWATLREEAAVRAWLLRITANVCGNWQAGHFGTHRRRTVPLDLTETFGVFAEGNHDGLQQGGVDDPFARSGPGSASHANALDLRRAVGRLESELRHVVALRFYAGMDATEIGATLDIPPATARTRLRRALLLLRERLAAPAPALAPALTPNIPTGSTHERGN